MFNISQFEWKAINRFGQKQSGKQLAENRAELENKLIQNGFSQIKIQRHFIFNATIKNSEITQFIKQLALLLSSAIPLKQSLTMLLNSQQNPKIYQWLKQISHSLEKGFSFSQSVETINRYLLPQEIQLIKIGEKSGNLATILTNMAQQREKSERTQQKVKKILFYPVMILMISFILSLLLLIFIVPKFADLYSQKSAALPFITDILFSLSHFLQTEYSTLLILFSIIFTISLILAKKTAILTYFKFYLLNKLPITNQIIRQARIIFFCQNLALMLNAHLRLDSILNAFLMNTENDPILAKNLAFSLQLLKQGYQLSDGLNPTIFENEMIQMLEIGEKSGQLSVMCHHIATIYQQKLDHQIDILSQLLEPMLMLIMGVIVGTILIGLYLPIFDMGAMIE